MGAEELELAPLDDHYADESRAALHHLERRLFEDATGERVDARRTPSPSTPPAASAPRSSSPPRGARAAPRRRRAR